MYIIYSPPAAQKDGEENNNGDETFSVWKYENESVTTRRVNEIKLKIIITILELIIVATLKKWNDKKVSVKGKYLFKF